jgi:DGQHR domain-containing protein
MSLSGYDARKELLAQRYNRASKSLFVIALPIHLVATHLPIPDPDEPFEGNRRVDMNRAKKFGEYWRENEKWATPPLLLDTMAPLSRDFTPDVKVAGVEFGILRLPHNSAGELEILDGQHRILGWKIATGQIVTELKSAREKLQSAREAQEPIAMQLYEKKVDDLEAQADRLRNEYTTVEILEGVTLAEHKQYFHDIAVNAKGITKSVTVGFDQRHLLNRVAMSLAEQYPLFEDRVDMEKDRVAAGNENLISGKNLVDIVKAVAVGVDGRITPRREEAFEAALEPLASGFLDLMIEAFPDLEAVREGRLAPVDLRSKSLLGSPTILRVLAGAYHGLAVDTSDEDKPRASVAGQKKARSLFIALAPHMGLPISDGWFDTGFFPDPSSRAPSSRSQDLRGLTERLVVWGEYGEVFVEPGF